MAAAFLPNALGARGGRVRWRDLGGRLDGDSTLEATARSERPQTNALRTTARDAPRSAMANWEGCMRRSDLSWFGGCAGIAAFDFRARRASPHVANRSPGPEGARAGIEIAGSLPSFGSRAGRKHPAQLGCGGEAGGWRDAWYRGQPERVSAEICCSSVEGYRLPSDSTLPSGSRFESRGVRPARLRSGWRADLNGV
jgi:hypothetical protein